MGRKRNDLMLILFGAVSIILVMIFKLYLEGAVLGVITLFLCMKKRFECKILMPVVASVLAVAIGIGTFALMVMCVLEGDQVDSDYWLIKSVSGDMVIDIDE